MGFLEFFQISKESTGKAVYFGFENLWPGWVIFLFLLSATGLWFWSYKDKLKVLKKRTKVALFALRMAAILVILFCIFKPVIIEKRESHGKHHVALLIDSSMSMSINDIDKETIRIDWLRKILAGKDFFKQFQGKCIVDVFAFSKGVKRLGEIDLMFNEESEEDEDIKAKQTAEKMFSDMVKRLGEIEAVAEETDIAFSMKQMVDDLKEAKISAVILLSDGNDNSYTDTVSALTRMGTEIYTVGVGKVAEVKEQVLDVEVLDVTANKYAIKNRVSVIKTKISVKGLKDETVYVFLKKDNEIIRTEMIRIEEGKDTYDVEMEYIPKETGELKFKIETSPVEEEVNKDNNIKKFFMKVLESQNKVLYVEGALRWEYKFLKRILEANEKINLSTVLLAGIKKIKSTGNKVNKFPESKEDLYKYDALILGSIGRSYFTDTQLKNIYDFVYERGGALITLGGDKSYGLGGFNDSEIEKLIPVHISGKGDGQYLEKFKIHITEEGKKHPVFWLGKDMAKNLRTWADMPELEGVNKVKGVKPGAVVIARYSAGKGDEFPAIVAQRFGKGKVLALLIDTTWKWDFKPWAQDSKETVYMRFWNQVVRWAITKEESSSLKDIKPLLVQSDRDFVAVNETISFRARILSENLLLDDNAEVMGEIKTPKGESILLKFDKSSEEKGIHLSSFVPQEEGEYLIEVYTKEDSLKEKADNLNFTAVEIGKELKDTELNERFLKRIASVSGGKYFHYTDMAVNNLADDITWEELKSTEIEEKELWSNIFVFILFLVLVVAEWILRRKYELI